MKTLLAWLALTTTAFASTPWAAGCAPAPEIGAGIIGAALSVAAVKWFRKRGG